MIVSAEWESERARESGRERQRDIWKWEREGNLKQDNEGRSGRKIFGRRGEEEFRSLSLCVRFVFT